MKRRFVVPEAIQTSAMDCGPAALKALLDGHGISVSYGRLREACQTGIDGTSIDQIEIAAGELGLAAEQIMVPVDHVLLGESSTLPALVITRQPNGFTHFVVAWSIHGDWVQVMDPGAGRRWLRKRVFLSEVHRHAQAVPAEAWREWSASNSFLAPLRARMKKISGVNEALIETADPARLDAAVRMVEALIDCDALRRGKPAGQLLARLASGEYPVPEQYWSVLPHTDDHTMVVLRGAVLLCVRGRTERDAAPASRELAAALSEKPAKPLRELMQVALAAGGLGPAALLGALAASAAGAVIEALLFGGFFDLGHDLVIRGQRLAAMAALLMLSAMLLALDLSVAKGALRLGRRLENVIRLRFLAKLPRLGDRYFQSRPISDMASRSHQVHQLRQAPELAAAFLRTAFEILFTTAGILWLYPGAALPAILLAVLCIGIPLAAQPALGDRDLRMRCHAGALSQFYLDSLLGLTAIRAHGAGTALRRQQEALLGAWARAGVALQRLAAAVEGVQLGSALSLAAWIVWHKLQPGSEPAGLLLLVYWILNLPALGQDAAAIAWQYPMLRNTALRVLEPLGAPEETETAAPAGFRGDEGVAITLDHVTVRAAGHVILNDVSASIPAGSHVAIVGASGAGKSSLAGLLLGWHRAEEGRVLVNGSPLDAATLRWLRTQTAWIDPQVQIWNRSMFENLRFGAPADRDIALDRNLHDAGLHPLLEKLPDGLQTPLGEGGALVSGGEGQRVRIGRALGRDAARLVILDEPARGLDSERRRAVLECARERWRGATLLAITHDLRDTLDFDRVLMIDRGLIVEDGVPRELAATPDSKYRRLLDVEDELNRGLWASKRWRRLTVRDGLLTEQENRSAYATSAR